MIVTVNRLLVLELASLHPSYEVTGSGLLARSNGKLQSGTARQSEKTKAACFDSAWFVVEKLLLAKNNLSSAMHFSFMWVLFVLPSMCPMPHDRSTTVSQT